MCNKFDFVFFSTNISNNLSIIKWNFWYWCFDIDFWKKINDEIDEQIIVAIFNVFDIDFDINIEKRKNFDTIIEREIISI